MTTVGSVEFEAKLATDGVDKDISNLQGEVAKKKIDIPAVLSLGKDGVSALKGGLEILEKASGILNNFTSSASVLTLALDTLAKKIDAGSEKLNNLKDKSLNAFKGFDSATAKVATLSDDAGGVASALQGLANDLDGQVSSTQLVTASYDVLSAGFSQTADQAKILGASAKAAQGGFSDLGTVSDATTTILNAYGKSADEAGKVTDQLIATQNAGKITVAQYGALIGQAASTAAAAGVSFEEFSAFVATATAKGLQAGPAITGLRQAIASVLKPAAEASELAQKLGVEFNATALRTKGLSGILKELNDKGAATPEVLTKLFGSVEAVAAIAPAAADGFKTFDSSLSQINNSAGAAEKAASKVANSFEGRLTAAANLGNEALVSLGAGVKAVVSPFIELGIIGVKAFNALPGPIKSTAGATLAVVGSTAGLIAAFASVASILPLVIKAYTVFKVKQAIGAALDKAETVATSAKSAAYSFLNIQTAAATTAKTGFTAATATNTVALVANKAATIAGSAAKLAWTVATSQQAIAAAGLALKLGLAAAAVYVLSEAFKRSEGAQFAQQLDATTEKLKQFQVEAEKAASAPAPGSKQPTGQPIGDRVDRVGDVLANKGPIEAARAALVEYQSAVFGAADSTDKFGNEFRILGVNLAYVTGEQRGNQLAQLALEKQFAVTGQSVEKTTELLAKYGLATLESSDISRLGADGTAKFKTEAEGQIKVLDQQIAALKNQKAPNEALQKQIDGQVATLESNKNALKQRIFALENGYDALQAAKNAEGEFKVTVEDTTKTLQDAIAKTELAGKQRIAGIKEATAEGSKTESQAAKEILQIEEETLRERQKQLEAALPKLKVAAAGADPAEAAKAKTEILNTEKELAQNRIQLAEKVLEARKQIEKDIAETAKKVDTGELSEQGAISELNRLKGAAQTPEAAKKAADEILKIRKSQIEAEIAQIQAGQKEIEALQAKGRIGEAQADEQLTETKKEETQKRIDLVREQIRNSTRESDRQRLIAEERKLAAELDKIDAEYQERKRKRAVEAFDDRRKILDAQLAQGKVTQEQANKALLDNDLKQNDLALKQEKERAKRLGAARIDADKLLEKARKGSLTAQEQDQLKQLGKIGELERKRVEILAAAYDREVALLEQKTRKKLALIQLESTKALVSIQKEVTAGNLSAEQADLKRSELREKSTTKELKAESDRLNKLKSLQLSTDPRKRAEQEQRLIEQQTKVEGLKLQQLEQEFQKNQALINLKLKGIDDELQRRSRAAALAETQEIEAITRQQTLGTATIEQVEARRLAASEARINAELEAEKQKLDKIRELPVAKGQAAQAEQSKRVAEQEQRLAEVRVRQAEVELQKRELARKQAISSIDDQINAEQRRSQKAIAGIDAELKKTVEAEQRKIDLVQKRFELEERRLKLNGDLAKAINDNQIAGLERQIARIDEARSLNEKLNSGESGSQVREVAARQISELGFSPNTSEVRLLEQRLAKEDELAIKKLQALEQEQALNRQLLEIENRKAVLQARQLELSAKQIELDAKRANIQAESAEKVAQFQLQRAEQLAPGRERDEALAKAQLELDVARQGREAAREQLGFAAQNRELAEQNKAATLQEIEGRKELLNIQQSGERAALADNLQSNRRKSELDVAAAADKSGQRANIQALNFSTITPINPRTMAGPEPGKLPEGAALEYQKSLADKFDKLANAVMTLANAPRNLTVSNSQNPTQDAAKIWADVVKLKARSQGGPE